MPEHTRATTSRLCVLLVLVLSVGALSFIEAAHVFGINGNILRLDGQKNPLTAVISLGDSVDFTNDDGDTHTFVYVPVTTIPPESAFTVEIPSDKTVSLSLPYTKFTAGTSYTFNEKKFLYGTISISGTPTTIAKVDDVSKGACTAVNVSNVGAAQNILFTTSSSCKFYPTSACSDQSVTSMTTTETSATFYILCDTIEDSQTIKVASPIGGLDMSNTFSVIDPAPVISSIHDMIVYTCSDFKVSDVTVGDDLTFTAPSGGSCTFYAGTSCLGSSVSSLSAGAILLDLSIKCTSYAASVNITVASVRGARFSNTFNVDFYPVTKLNYNMVSGTMVGVNAILHTNTPTAAHCAMVCDTNYGCAAFDHSSDGTCIIYASVVKGNRVVAGTESYFNYLPTNRSTAGYMQHQDTIYSGNVISATFDASNMTECLDTCESLSECVGFVWLFPTLQCELKSQMTNSVVSSDGSSSWYRTSAPGYKTTRFASFYPYAGKNFRVCSQACDDASGCTGFYYGPDNVCWMENISTGEKPLEAFRHYTKL